MGYIRLLKQKIGFGIFVILSCACLGSIRGAMKESREPFIGVTQEDLETAQQSDRGAPDLTGIIPLAAEQVRWRNFSYAIIYAGRGVVIYCILTAVYWPVCFIREKKGFGNRKTE